MIIPFNKADFNLSTVMELQDLFPSKGENHYLYQVSNFIKDKFNILEFIPMTSGTHALEAAVILSKIQPTQYVITPSFAFPSTGNAILLRNAHITFCEINEHTLCIDENDCLNRIVPSTKCIMPVHYGGVSCDMDPIIDACQQKNIFLIEDAAQSINAKYKDRFLGTLGDIGCYSFHSTKNIQCGEGGGLCINTPGALIDEAYKVVNKGTDRHLFLNGLVDKYTWKSLGSSYLPADLLMAVLLSQLFELENLEYKRKMIYDTYYHELKKISGYKGIRHISEIPSYSKSNYHIFYVLFETEELRNSAINKLKQRHISSYFHYLPLHSSDMGKKLGYKEGDFPVTERVSKTILRLPIYNSMTMKECSYVLDHFYDVLKEL
ncbi:MAG: dTDP-4-amino-4,6-dideoxygalactose transaminase [Tissierellales bacterium]|nr:dTDP-4-amino-4,6-dideoxygalactose transaminase [Tissierellales bacterium]MBN2826719.1 dTDP-4-amino-4,6-dideoxygalactose transaminase [Tissierellales bacterium]